jgi:hypothetical protein
MTSPTIRTNIVKKSLSFLGIARATIPSEDLLELTALDVLGGKYNI